jgi:tRNA(fMet)-specific endonuclease VapC
MEEILPFTEKSSRIAGYVISELRRKQSLIDIRDLFIGAICIESGIPLLTRNIAHFERIKGFENCK